MNRGFRKAIVGPRLAVEEAQRQGRGSTLAFLTLGRENALLFLNAHDTALGGRPLDVAIASAEGRAAVEQRMEVRKVS